MITDTNRIDERQSDCKDHRDLNTDVINDLTRFKVFSIEANSALTKVFFLCISVETGSIVSTRVIQAATLIWRKFNYGTRNLIEMWLIKERIETEKNGDRKADKNIEIVWLIFHFPPRFQDRQNHPEASSNFIQLTTVSDYRQPLSWFLILTKEKYFCHTINPLFSKLYRSRWLNNRLFFLRFNFFRPRLGP